MLLYFKIFTLGSYYMPLNYFNPWWKASSVPKNQVGRIREILDVILSFLDYKQIIILYGLRRSGKATLMYQIIDHLLRKRNISPFRILYFSFDEQDFSLNHLLDISTRYPKARIGGARKNISFSG